MRLPAVLVLLALVGQAATAQQPPAAAVTVTVRGMVTSVNDVPLPRVRVAVASELLLRAQPSTPIPDLESAVLTDARGQFTINVPVAQPRVTFTKAGHIPLTAEVLRQGAAVPDVRVRLSRGGAISGVVLDRTGVRLMLAAVTARRLDAPSSTPLSTTTNDIGEFRFGGLADGAYSIAARPSDFALTGPVAERQKLIEGAAVQGPTVTVSTGTEVSNISLTVETPSDMGSRINPRPVDPDPKATASIAGRVVTSEGLPIARAVVAVRRSGLVPRVAETDERGRYEIDRLGAGEYTVEAQKYGFVNRQYGQAGTSSIGRGVAVRNGQVVGSIDVTLARGGAITGTILDEFGEPAQNVALNALQVQVIAGRRRALRASSLGPSRTDDRGQYRLFGLQPGTYVVQAQVRDAVSGDGGYAPLFYPGALSVDQATPTKVDLNTAVSGIDFTLSPGTVQRVSGTVLDTGGSPARARITLSVSERSGATWTEPLTGSASPDGSFAFTNVPPGDYTVQAYGSAPARDQFGAVITGPLQFAASFVTVAGRDPAPVQLRLSPGATLRGRVRYEGFAETPVRAVTVQAFPSDFDRGPIMGQGPLGFTLQADNSFEYKGVFGPTLLRVEPRQSDWYLKSVVFKGQDLSDTPFDFGVDGTFADIEVVIAATGAIVNGRVTDERAAPVADYAVLLFSTFRDRWFTGSRWVKTGRPAQNGTYSIQGLPPGDYWVAAIERVTATPGGGAPPPEADLLESLSSRATRITLGEGQTRDVTLRLIRR